MNLLRGYFDMPVSYRFDSGILVYELTGAYSPDDVQGVFSEAFRDPACPLKPRILIDLSNSQSIATRSSSTVNDMAAYMKLFRSKFGNRIAFVVSDNLVYGLVRMGAASAGITDFEVEIFRSQTEGIRWLLESAHPSGAPDD